MWNKRVSLFAMLALLGSSLAACSTGGKQASDGQTDAEKSPSEQTKKPVTLTMYEPVTSMTEEDFMQQAGNLIQKKFPHITIKYVHAPDTNFPGHIADMLAAQQPIDIFLNADTNHFRLITPFQLEQDLSELIKTHNYDLTRLEPNVVDAVRALGNGKLYALPYKMSVLSLMYNKDLFDKFAVAYPKDGMTWDETYDTAAKMTRKDGETQYRGFVTQSYNMAWMNQLSIGFADPKTDKPLFTTEDKWAQVVKNINRFYDIPGNALAENSFRPISDAFFKQQVVAMYAYMIPTTQQELNWDLVTLPEYGHLRGVGSQAMSTLAYVTSISKHKDDAFDVIAYMTSDEFQMHLARQALGLPIVTTQAVKDAYGQDNAFLQGKNLKSLTKNSPAKPFPQSPYQAITNNQLEKLWYQLGKGQLDVNTALRNAAEQAEKEIAALKAGGS